MAPIGAQFKPGDAVPHSGIYRVTHDPLHAQDHEVTCLFGKHSRHAEGAVNRDSFWSGLRATSKRRTISSAPSDRFSKFVVQRGTLEYELRKTKRH